MNASNQPLVGSDLCEAASTFTACRSRLVRIAVRLLGDTGEAEDIVQETWIRWQTCDRSAVRNAPAFLATTTTRLALNALHSARARHETYMGDSIPEPLDTNADTAARIERSEAVEFAIRRILETLTPAERTAYVLRQAFDYPYEQIADVLHQTQTNVRQLVSRARRHLAEEPRDTARPVEHRPLFHAFVVAARTGNLSPLERLLVSTGHGGSAS